MRIMAGESSLNCNALEKPELIRGKHAFLPLGMGEDKTRIMAGDSSLNCNALEKPELINPAITDETKVRDLQRLQEQQLGKWPD